MIKIPVYNPEGKKLEEIALSSNIYGLKVQPTLLHLVTTIFLGNQRKGTAKVKTRAERRGGGKKPFKQKGTASARAGTTRSPIWRKGGRVFGPTGEQNYHRDLPRKVRIKSLLMSLSAKAQKGAIWGMSELAPKEISTKALAKTFSSLPETRSILLVVDGKNTKLSLSTRNLPNVTVRLYNNINVLDVLNHDTILILKAAVPMIEEKWGAMSFKGVMSDEDLSATLAGTPIAKKPRAEKVAKSAAPKKPAAKKAAAPKAAKPATKAAPKAKVAKKPKA